MSLRANFQKNYLLRYLVIAVSCLAFAAWFAYDGFVGYPKKLIYAQAYEKLKDLDEDARRDQWRKIVAENNWPQKTPDKKASEIQSGIAQQYFWAIVTLLIGLPALITYFRSKVSWVEMQGDGITTSWGQSLNFKDVVNLNKRKWREKGIARATYTVGGRKRVFVFDDFKFDREPMGQMLRNLETFLNDDQIEGGTRDAPFMTDSERSDSKKAIAGD